MLRNYFKIAWRNLERNKLYSFINIFGLAIGLAVCMLIVLYRGHETSYDRFHKDADRIVWIQGKFKIGTDSIFSPRMSYATAPLGKQHSSFVEDFVRSFIDYKQPVIQNEQLPTFRFAENNFLLNAWRRKSDIATSMTKKNYKSGQNFVRYRTLPISCKISMN